MNNKIVEIMCQILRVNDKFHFVQFHKEEGSIEAFDEVLLFL